MQTKTITALFVGLGSIGTRHLKNLTALCAQRGIALRVDALRSDLSRPLRDGVAQQLTAQFTSLSQANTEGQCNLSGARPTGTQGGLSPEVQVAQLPFYDIAFITNPTAYHADVLAQLQGRVGALFIEKPIFDATQTDLVLAEIIPPAQKAYVAAPMRWCGAMLALKEYLANHPEAAPYSARAICSSYLPDWRPGVDYRTVYSAHRALGGGVTIDLIHEWDYLVDLFGKPLAMHHFKGTYSALEIDSDDLSIYIAQYPTLLCELHLDYFGRTYRRNIELFTKEGTLVADFGAGTLTLPDGRVENYAEDVNKRYLRELDYFLDYALDATAIQSKNPPAEGLDVLRLTLGQ
ncbi:MAG: gfo/Idh/MocA family oxidoreductase [Faecalibacterium sp.]